MAAQPPPRRVFAGVCGGLGEYLAVDPVLVQVAFVVLAALTQGAALIAYVVLWVVMPEDAAQAAPEAIHGSGGRGDSGALVFGVLLMAAGAVWLVEAVGMVSVDWGIAAAGALVVVGALLLVTDGRAARGGFITLGMLLTLALAVMRSSPMRGTPMHFDSGFGERAERPRTVSELQSPYSHAFGSMAIDFRSLDLPSGTTKIVATTSFGSTEVRLVPDIPVRVVARASFGSVDVLGQEVSGVNAERTVTSDGYDAAMRRVELEVSSTFGSVAVRR